MLEIMNFSILYYIFANFMTSPTNLNILNIFDFVLIINTIYILILSYYTCIV